MDRIKINIKIKSAFFYIFFLYLVLVLVKSNIDSGADRRCEGSEEAVRLPDKEVLRLTGM